jgi:hypothetical protein
MNLKYKLFFIGLLTALPIIANASNFGEININLYKQS